MPFIKTAKALPSSIPLIFIIFMIYAMYGSIARAQDYPILSVEQKEWLGQQIFNNECARQIECLTSWNSGENFPSLGIGHFIWYQKDQHEIFKESFPELVQFLQQNNIAIPDWIIDNKLDSPWPDRESFLADINNEELSGLRSLLVTTIPLQTEFIIQRFETSLERILATLPEDKIRSIEEKFYLLANTAAPYGLYALMDYVNFKGEGIAESEQYAGQGWGLLQVLQSMPDNNDDILESFVLAAKTVLENRVANSPVQRNETQWLQGWFSRLDTYLPNMTITPSNERNQNDF